MNSDTAITHPGNFIASIPGVLGYYPQESVIIVTAYTEPGKDEAFYGPVFRVDLSMADRLQEVFDSVPAEDIMEAVGHFAILVTRIPNSKTARAAIRSLLELTDPRGLPLVDACWHASEIANYTPYSLIFGPPMDQLIRAGVPDSWVSGGPDPCLVDTSDSDRVGSGKGSLPSCLGRFIRISSSATRSRCTKTIHMSRSMPQPQT